MYTKTGIYTKNEGTTVATYDTLYNNSTAVADSSRNVYSNIFDSPIIHKQAFNLNPSPKAIEYENVDGMIHLNRNITAWAIGENEKYLYAIAPEANRLLQIDTESWTVAADRYVGSKPTDVDIRDGILYISLEGSTHIAKVDTNHETDFMAPITELEVGELTADVAAGTEKVYYTNTGSWGRVSVWQSVYTNYAATYSEPKLTMSPDASSLWIGETDSSGSNLYRMDTASGQIVQHTTGGFYSSTKEILQDDPYVYYAARRFSSSDLSRIYGEYKDGYYYAHLLFAKGNLVIGSTAFYDRDTFNPIYKLPFPIGNGYIKDDGSIILYGGTGLPSENGPFILYKFDSLEDMKSQVEEGMRPKEAEFLDENPDTLRIEGNITFRPGPMDLLVDHYEINYYDISNQRVAATRRDSIYPYQRQPDGSYSYSIWQQTLPPEVNKIGIVPVTRDGIRMEGAKLLIRLWDFPAYFVGNAILTDTDPAPGVIEGKVSFARADDERAGDRYAVYFADENGFLGDPIGSVAASGKPGYELGIPKGTAVPEGAYMLAIQMLDQDGLEAPGYVLTEIPDLMTLAPAAEQITVFNEPPGASDKITVTGLHAGDLVKAYKDNGELYGQVSVATGSTSAVISGLALDENERLLYVTVTTPGKKESFPVYNTYPPFGGTGGGAPVVPAPGGGVPVVPAPVVPEPGVGGPVTPAPGGGAPVTPAPGGGAPVTPAPGGGTPVTPAPGGGTPVTPAPGGGAPVAPAPGGGTPVVPVPGGGTPDGDPGGDTGAQVPQAHESGTVALVKMGKSADGASLAAVTLNDAALDAELKKGSSESNELKLKVSNPADEIQVTLRGDQLTKLMQSKEKAWVHIEADDSGFVLPASALKATGMKIDGEDRVVVSIRKLTEAAAAHKSLDKQSFQAVAPLFDFSIRIKKAAGRLIEINNTAVYLGHIIRFKLSSAPVETLSAVTIDPVTGTVSPVPATFKQEGDIVTATIYRKGNSVYSIVTNKTGFNDLKPSDFARNAIDKMATRMVIRGYTDGSFKPDGSVTRAEFASMLIKALGIVPSAESSAFKDVKKGAWYYDAVSAGVRTGLLKGYTDGNFRPNQTITQQEMAVVLYKALTYGGYEQQSSGTKQLFDTDKGYDAWSEQAVDTLLREGILNKSEPFKIEADKKSTRAESAELLYRVLKTLKMI
ncbi:S-layer homology domain-containing protein [Paenibacillus beijingensis]|uniref:S-layer homology domain-containing protein n=1 Tax=Paenibacillus beijingensis TaxID=1126833 RepID=UPI0011DE5727|nr:S-layer homology domain-containing protein [Paenibacillus beijingensis]